jgi:hypothetical protein
MIIASIRGLRYSTFDVQKFNVNFNVNVLEIDIKILLFTLKLKKI